MSHCSKLLPPLPQLTSDLGKFSLQRMFIPFQSKDTLMSLSHPKAALPPSSVLQPTPKSRDFLHFSFSSCRTTSFIGAFLVFHHLIYCQHQGEGWKLFSCCFCAQEQLTSGASSQGDFLEQPETLSWSLTSFRKWILLPQWLMAAEPAQLCPPGDNMPSPGAFQPGWSWSHLAIGAVRGSRQDWETRRELGLQWES